MAYENVSVSGIESFQPAVDYRASGRVGVISGKNFAWDAAGVYSAYANRLVAGSTSIGTVPDIAQSIDLETDVHIGVRGKIWKFTPSSLGSPVGAWGLIQNFGTLIEPNYDLVPYSFRKWSSGYLNGNRYACSWNYGVYKVNVSTNAYTRLTSGTVAGFPSDVTPVVAICETNGRMLYCTATTLYWSAPNAPENLVPALGGAGFQVLAERISGNVVGMTPVSQGAIVWTDTGGLAVEFIGGDSVFRFWQLSTKAIPLSGFAIARLPNDDYAILTRLGVFSFNNLAQPTPAAPLFNEFMRENLRSKPNAFGHIWYSITDNRIYIGLRTQFSAFLETYALDIGIDRWGVFSESHMGFIDYGPSRGQVAWVNNLGVAAYLLTPVDARKNRESPTAPGTFIGLNSEILIGWMRAENFVPSADTVQELHEVSVNRAIPFGVVAIVNVDEGFVTDPSPTTFDEGLVTALNPALFDEGFVDTANLPTNYRLEFWTDLFAFPPGNSNVIIPTLVSKNREVDLWVGAAPTTYARLRFIANNSDEFYRVNSLNLTFAYYGNLA